MSTTKLNMGAGFTLIEVLIALFLSTIILLGLAAGELKSLQYATNSFNYTLSLVQANNAVEKTWSKLCDLQTGALSYDADFVSSLQPQFAAYTLVLTPAAGAGFTNQLDVNVSWNDARMVDGLESRIRIDAMYPQVCR